MLYIKQALSRSFDPILFQACKVLNAMLHYTYIFPSSSISIVLNSLSAVAVVGHAAVSSLGWEQAREDRRWRDLHKKRHIPNWVMNNSCHAVWGPYTIQTSNGDFLQKCLKLMFSILGPLCSFQNLGPPHQVFNSSLGLHSRPCATDHVYFCSRWAARGDFQGELSQTFR